MRLPVRELERGSHDFCEGLRIVALQNRNWGGEIEKLIASREPGPSYRGIVRINDETRCLEGGSERLGALWLALAPNPFMHATRVFHAAHSRRSLEPENLGKLSCHRVDLEAGNLIKPVAPGRLAFRR